MVFIRCGPIPLNAAMNSNECSSFSILSRYVLLAMVSMAGLLGAGHAGELEVGAAAVTITPPLGIGTLRNEA